MSSGLQRPRLARSAEPTLSDGDPASLPQLRRKNRKADAKHRVREGRGLGASDVRRLDDPARDRDDPQARQPDIQNASGALDSEGVLPGSGGRI